VTRQTALLAGAAAFLVLATANSGGYRFGISDQAYYLPAVALAEHPDLFPRDRVLLATQTGLMVSDDLLALAARATGLDLPAVFLVAYVVTVLALFAGAVAFARTLGLGWWATTAALLILTLRHRIAKTGANSLEGYMHPRQLAFALGVTAWVCLLKGRRSWAFAVAGVAWLIHPTTALWFAVSIAVAVAVSHRPRLAWILGIVAAGSAAAAWAVTRGPLGGRLTVMDDAWLSVLADKDYLFAADWPAYAWLTNLAYVGVVAAVYRARRNRGQTIAGEGALIVGLLTLVLGFLVSVPLTEARVALAVQLQVNRVFWLLDFVVAVYVAWWITGSARPRWPTHAVVAVALLAALSVGRGIFLLTGSDDDRVLVRRDLADTAWTDAMRWVGRQAADWHVLADPGHAWKYGTSVRAAALRDTVLESSKDTAMAMYDRTMAMRVRERIAALDGFEGFSTDDIRRLDARFDVDVAVMEAGQPLDLPVLYRNDRFVVYDLR